MNAETLQKRLILFGVAVMKLARQLPKTPEAQHIRNQMLRSATSPGLHYGEAIAAESRKDFAHKLQIVNKELRETHNALQMVLLMEFLPGPIVNPVERECDELIAIFTKSVLTVTRKDRKK
jgi:four helix bundle protein